MFVAEGETLRVVAQLERQMPARPDIAKRFALPSTRAVMAGERWSRGG